MTVNRKIIHDRLAMEKQKVVEGRSGEMGWTHTVKIDRFRGSEIYRWIENLEISQKNCLIVGFTTFLSNL